MSLSNKKILVSGCGVSWSGQERKTWVNILKIAGCSIVDAGGPAVSNQWILNQAILQTINDKDIDQVVIQLTSLGKLDVEINPERMTELVEPDHLRNFTVNGIWPSSASTDHIAKQLWQKWLCSPGLELQDIYCKLILFSDWCRQQNKTLLVFQGYSLPWTTEQLVRVKNIIKHIDKIAIKEYKDSEFYLNHDPSNYNTVPCLDYQFKLAEYVSNNISVDCRERVQKMQAQYFTKQQNGTMQVGKTLI